MKRLSSYEPFNKMADAVLYGGIVALSFGSTVAAVASLIISGRSSHCGVCRRFSTLRTYSLVALSAGSFQIHVSPCHVVGYKTFRIATAEANCKHTAQDAVQFVRYDCEASSKQIWGHQCFHPNHCMILRYFDTAALVGCSEGRQIQSRGLSPVDHLRGCR